MSSTDENCSICKRTLAGDKTKELKLSCKHRFHVDCATKRLKISQSPHCPICKKADALEHAIHRALMDAKSASSAAKYKDHSSGAGHGNSDEEDWICPYCDKPNQPSRDSCEQCGEGRSVDVSTVRSMVASVNERSPSYQAKPPDYSDDFNDNDQSGDIRPMNRQRWSRGDAASEWTCDECEYLNQGADALCKNCRQGKRPTNKIPAIAKESSRNSMAAHHSPASLPTPSKSKQPITPDPYYDTHSTPKHKTKPRASISSEESDHSPPPPLAPPVKPSAKENDSDDVPDVKPKSSKKKKHPSTVKDPVPVYISDFPSTILDDTQLENRIRQRVEKILSIELTEIRCYSKLGVGVMYVADKQARDRILEHLPVLPLDPNDSKTNLRFGKVPNLVSYIVFNADANKTDSDYPATKDIMQQWETINHGEQLETCEPLNTQFPNIFRIVSTSLDQLINSLNYQDIRVKKHFGQIYFCADCSFFEDVPKSVTQGQLESAILHAIEETDASSCSLHVQLNKQNGIACVIAGNQARKWAAMSYVSVNGKSLLKRNELTCRLFIHPIPQALSIDDILQHPNFRGKATVFKQTPEGLILEVSNKDVSDDCLKRALIRVNNKHVLNIDFYTAAGHPEGGDINDETWYDDEMLKCSKPDIMPFVAQPDHFIFRYKWNARAWLNQFEKTSSEKALVNLPKDPREQRGTAIDLLRHQLQMTVMLNTLASIRHGRYFIGDREVPLKINKGMKTILYNHQSKLKRSDEMPSKTPFRQTKIKVENMDCVVSYQNLVRQEKNPVLLNMANAITPGGGYRKGDGAQEENLFRRSDYFRSLDVEMDSFLSERSNRFRCTADGREEPLPQTHKMYPIDEFGAIYTSGITFFRHSQDVGYEYLDRPIENVCAIAMAAYRDPKLDGDKLSSKYAVGTRKKIENLFSIAHHHGHQSIVLSAFGCGAFRNPPGHVARIFYSVIEQYAGFFDTIVFAIIDDHNSGQRLNPDGNLKPFFDVLDGRHTKIEAPTYKPNTMSGPYRVSSDGEKFKDINIYDLEPCKHAAKCFQIGDPKHTSEYSHPPLCARAANFGKCDLTQHFVHEASFIHRKPCQYAGECRNINDKKHCEEFDHPAECPQKGTCQNTDDDHMKQFRHVPLCEKGITCLNYQRKDRDHCEKYRHCQPRCRFGNHCIMFHDKNHIREEKHPFTTPCPRTPFHCSEYDTLSGASDIKSLPTYIQQHCLEYAHVCRFGRTCKINTPLHQEKTIHIIRHLCPNDGKCNRMHQEEHLNSYTHTGVADIRRLCRVEKCKERFNKDHNLKFRHPKSSNPDGIVRYYGLNIGIDFVKNQIEMIKRVLDYVEKKNWKSLPSDKVPSDVLNWFRTVRPVHRCNPVIFESILLHGHAMSRDYMDNLKKPKFVATSVMQHSRIDSIANIHIPQYAQYAREYIIAVVTAEFDKADFPRPEGVPEPRQAPANHTHNIKEKEKKLSDVLSKADLDALRTKAIEIAQASIKLHTNPAGIGHAPDKALGTHKRVFSILGPHLGHYYGDVFIIFKREILHHPDADYSMLAATTYGQSANAYKWCPWLGTPPDDLSERIDRYHHTKLHASIPGHEYAIALQLMAITSLELNLKSMDINVDTLLKRWLKTDSHRSIEAHLPQLIPVKYIDHIYMPQGIFDSLNSQTRRSIDALFKHCTTITSHTFPSGDPMGPFGSHPSSKDRADYQDEVVDDLIKRYKRDAENPPATPIEGAVITIPESNFTENFLLPLTISQACDLHQMEHGEKPDDDIAYIYWEAIHGDVMLVISNGLLETKDDKQPDVRCLLCYIAPKIGSDESYHEQTTYINCGSPFKHHEFATTGKYKAKSNTFHLGSNTDDFVTYCLEIHRKSGLVVLRQAGANAIYNHEEISYEFTNKKELDVSKLEYVHVSANAKNATVRNLIVCFEKRSELHPTFDKNFKKDGNMPKSYSPSGASASSPLSSSSSSSSSSSMIPCLDNVNCLLQYSTSSEGKHHNSKYSHPCRYSELCRNKECVLIHDPHPSPLCRDDKKCRRVIDPFHRAEYRHTGLADFLVPCRDQKKCSNTSNDHRMKYSHGEVVFEQKPVATIASPPVDVSRPPCKYGSGCKIIDDSNHRMKYSHEEVVSEKKSVAAAASLPVDDDHRPLCKFGSGCKMLGDSSHRARFSHRKPIADS